MPRDIETFVDNSGHSFLLSHNQASLEDDFRIERLNI